MKNKVFFLIVTFVAFYSFAQTIDESWKIFYDKNVARVDITISPESLEWMYANVFSDSFQVVTLRYRNIYLDQTFDSVGIRIKGNTSRENIKKSFKISFNTYKKGRKFNGIEKMNLDAESVDPTISRNKISIDHFPKINMPAARSNYTEVYINGIYYGLYANFEHIDEEFLKKNFSDDSGNLWKCSYPADLAYLGDDPNTYKNLTFYSTIVYELNTNEEEGDYLPLVRLIKAFNSYSLPSMIDSIESIIYVPEVLKYCAANVILGNWDDYRGNSNNYYLYYEPSVSKFHVIPYDYDESNGIDWLSFNWGTADPYNFPKYHDVPKPMIDKLLSVPEYRNLFTHAIEFFNANEFSLNNNRSRIDSIYSMIYPYAVADTFRTKDFGFTINDFVNSFSETSYSKAHVKYGLKQFASLRNHNLPAMLNYVTSKPITYSLDFFPKNPGPNDSIYIYTSSFSNVGLNNVSVNLYVNGSVTPQVFNMIYKPVTGTKVLEESDRYYTVLPPLGTNAYAEFSIIAKDVNSTTSTYPSANRIKIKVTNPVVSGLKVNEFLADNLNSTPDQNGEHDDWIELFNPTNQPVLLTGKYLTDKATQLNKWRFTQENLYIPAGGYVVVWCDEQETQSGLHSNFKLSKSGEFIAFVDTNGVSIIDSISFGAQTTDISFGRFPDGNNNWISMNPTPGSLNIALSVQEESITPLSYDINAFPNPFNPSTTINYSIPASGFVKITLYDALGSVVKSIVNQEQLQGSYSVRLISSDLSTGIYFCNLSCGNFNKTIKLALIK